MGQKVINRVADQTSGAGALLEIDLGNTETWDAVIIAAINSAGADATGLALQLYDEPNSPGVGAGIPYASAVTYATPGIGLTAGTSAAVVIGPGANERTFLARRTKVVVTAGAASTTRLIIYSVKVQ